MPITELGRAGPKFLGSHARTCTRSILHTCVAAQTFFNWLLSCFVSTDIFPVDGDIGEHDDHAQAYVSRRRSFDGHSCFRQSPPARECAIAPRASFRECAIAPRASLPGRLDFLVVEPLPVWRVRSMSSPNHLARDTLSIDLGASLWR